MQLLNFALQKAQFVALLFLQFLSLTLGLLVSLELPSLSLFCGLQAVKVSNACCYFIFLFEESLQLILLLFGGAEFLLQAATFLRDIVVLLLVAGEEFLPSLAVVVLELQLLQLGCIGLLL